MQLKLVRSHREGGVVSKSVIFCLDARVQLTSEEQANVNRYKLGGQVIYNSEASKRHLDAHQTSLATGTAGGIAKSFLSLAMAALNLNITINGLQRGQHIECKSLDELLGAEEALMEACRNLRTYLDTAATFDGREVLIDFGGKEPAVVSSSPPPMLVAPAPQASPSPAAEFAPVGQLSSAGGGASMMAPAQQSYASDANPFEDLVDRARRFWASATQNQRLLVIAGGVVLALLLLKACS